MEGGGALAQAAQAGWDPEQPDQVPDLVDGNPAHRFQVFDTKRNKRSHSSSHWVTITLCLKTYVCIISKLKKIPPLHKTHRTVVRIKARKWAFQLHTHMNSCLVIGIIKKNQRSNIILDVDSLLLGVWQELTIKNNTLGHSFLGEKNWL